MEQYTIKELAKICNCTKQTISKYVTTKGLLVELAVIKGNKTRLVSASDKDIKEIFEAVNSGKGDNGLSLNNYQPVTTSEYMEKYFSIKSQYDSLSTTYKLLEDRQGLTLNENKELNNKVVKQSEEIGNLSAQLSNEVKVSNFYKRICMGLGSALGIIIFLLLIRVIFIH